MPNRIPHNEKALILKVAEGDEKAFRALFDTYRNRLYFYTLQITSSKEMAEDIVQDTFLKIWLRREQLRQVEHFNAYIFRVAQNTILSGIRRKALEAAILAGKVASPHDEESADERLHFKMIKTALQKAVNSLPEQQKKAYKLRREDGLGIQQIARIMGISPNTAKRHLTEAHKTLRQCLRHSFPHEGGILMIISGLLN